MLQPLAYECLCHPCAIAVGAQLSAASTAPIYVAEMLTNRILRFVQQPKGVFHCRFEDKHIQDKISNVDVIV